MASKPRGDAFGGFYHVLACGNCRATIFHDDADSRAYWSVSSAIASATM